MQYLFPNSPSERVELARRAVLTVGNLDWPTRVLLAAAEAADAVIRPAYRDTVACVVADKCSDAIVELSTVRSLDTAIRDAIASAGLDDVIPSHSVHRLVWRVVFDLWGGPVK